MTVCLTIDDNQMSSKDTPHTATRHGGKWKVSWLPGRELSRDQARAAMHLAWCVAADASVGGSNWPSIAADAGELGMSGQEAVAICAEIAGAGGKMTG
jgi:hypothetical protein